MSQDLDIFGNLDKYLKGGDNFEHDDDIEYDEEEMANDIKKAQKIKPSKPKKSDESPEKRRKGRKAARDGSQSSQEDDVEVPSSSRESAAGPSSGVNLTLDLDEQLKNIDKQYKNIMKTKRKSGGGADKALTKIQKEYEKLVAKSKKPGRRSKHVVNTELARIAMLQQMLNAMTNAGGGSDGRASGRGGRLRVVPADCDEEEIESVGTSFAQMQPPIDLCSSPMLNIPGVVTLDSDDDDANLPLNRSFDASFETENYEISLKIRWNGKVERFAHRRYQKFRDLIYKLAEKEKSDPKNVVLDLNEKIIHPDDTPDSIGYTIAKFISGRILTHGVLRATNANSKKKDENMVELKIQSDLWKKPMLVSIGKNQTMKVVVIKCAEELKCRPEHVKLRFDGDSIALDATPEELELEGGEILDCRIVK